MRRQEITAGYAAAAKAAGSRCTGCGSCSEACPVHAVSMEYDKEGFIYPRVEQDVCVGCGKCTDACHILSRTSGYEKPQLIYGDFERSGNGAENITWYAAMNRDNKVRDESSSGGIFPALADEILRRDGLVCGACLDADTLSVNHVLTGDPEIIRKMRGSKYIQSRTDGIYGRIKDALEKGKTVLFTGTPCQISALRKSLEGTDTERLYAVDLFCHGVSSTELFRHYIKELFDNDRIKDIRFRDKSESWERYVMRIEHGGHKVYSAPFKKDPFLSAFITGLSLRPSCYQCSAKGFPRKSDISLGDFWMAGRIFPDMNDHKGLSLVAVHTDKGRRLFEDIKGSLEIREIPKHKISEYYSMSGTPTEKPDNRDEFFRITEEKGIVKAASSCVRFSVKERVREMLRNTAIRMGIYDTLRRLR